MGKFNFKTLGAFSIPLSTTRTKTSHGGKVRKRAAEFLPRKIAVFRSSFHTNRSLREAPGGLLLTAEQDAAAYEEFRLLHNTQEAADDSPTWRDSLSEEHQNTICLSPKQVQYQELIHEIVLTEKTYVADLSLVYHIFAKGALDWEDLPQPLRQIFENITQIIQVHQCLLQVPWLTIYTAYFVHFEAADDLVASCLASKTDNFGNYLRHRTAWPECRNLTLQSFLLKPIQRLMKYPLFFKSLIDCLDIQDVTVKAHFQVLSDIEKVIRKIESQKKEAEDLKRLEDLETRIKGIEGIQLAVPNRQLVFEGPLVLLPTSQKPLSIKSSSELSSLHSQPHPNVKRSSSFSLSPQKKNIYVFLFNDHILFTKVRSKTRQTPCGRSNAFYGPQPETLFKVVRTPGQLTCVDQTVTRPIEGNKQQQFPSWRHHRVGSPTTHEAHPLQFICSIAARHVFNMHFEAKTSEEKQAWCHHLETVLPEHVKTPSSWHLQRRSSMYSYQSQQSLTYDSCTTMLDDVDVHIWADCEESPQEVTPPIEGTVDIVRSQKAMLSTKEHGGLDDRMELDGNKESAENDSDDEGFVTAHNSLDIGGWLQQQHRPEIDRGEKLIRGMQETGRIPDTGPFSMFKMDSLLRGARMRP
ncbi:hypothetical protein DFQ28_008328 [Apophysomyces sp. BC1034]|nr:hypothetical protein DFQ30_008058 [Apophysomyces sp. BC1015]KAG0175592.1 hypothetical protein DFQ29_007094 [Apophysomyces sp. BC1021]KAG0186096.1 hypothetical protein DFQ28_008328 [Apophysomyces sp. BC1034]